ncbi:endonuclease/exonuclease/phosphatase family protein [Streptomyces kanamyceticus]|uniref:endonuclease/exonuclease/phosphatase family protein n=1 Tax=Streptomyces kanamyceticus TaxID=1967 RepID=UPI0037DD5807
MSERDDDFRVAIFNVEHNGVDRDGTDHRWHLAMDIMAAIQPHLLLRQELTRAHMHGARAMWEEASRLGGHRPFLAGATPESANPTGVYADRMCQPTEYFEHATAMWHPVCNPVFRIKNARKKLSVASIHLCSFDPARRASEAKRLTTLAKPGMAAIIGGDTNSYPHTTDETTPLPDWSAVTDRSHFEHRTVERDGARVSDTVPDEILAGEHHGQSPLLVDLAHHAATALGQPEALMPTASLWRKDQGGPQRIDRIYATPQIASTLTKVEVIVNDEVIEASDHAPVVATFSLARLCQVLSEDLTDAA